ncbi:hypothetical protein AAMO2058_000840900 [Amorphochlora amoebiformis]|mmetsp:Transcript_14643/g.23198  ORF Transcript_14643/g.23198 Transcript_14643/m.23198 type:complete len:149 (-) Transcript_14643:183-629(-)
MSFLRPIIDFVSPEMPYEYEFPAPRRRTWLSHVWDAAKAVTITGVAAIGIWKLNGLYQDYLSEQKGFETVIRKRVKLQEIVQTRNEALKPFDTEEGLKSCIVCMAQPRKVAFVPCGHYVACGDCSRRLNQQCPICRKRITKFLVIYNT